VMRETLVENGSPVSGEAEPREVVPPPPPPSDNQAEAAS